MTGFTGSTDFPTVNPLQATNNASPNTGSYTAFVAKLNAAGSALLYSTFLGGSSGDRGYGIAADSSGNAYVTGTTTSTNFPTVNPLQATNNASPGAGSYTAFVSKLNAAGSALLYSTYLGGSFSDGAAGIAVDSSGNAYVTGYTYSDNFPTVNPIQATNHGFFNAFVTKLNSNGSALVYSTYLGGNTVIGSGDGASGLAVDSSGNAYITGSASSADFPVTSGAFQTTNHAQAGYADAFVTKLNPAGTALVYSTYLGGSGRPHYEGGDAGRAIAVDAAGNAYVTGLASSINFPPSTLSSPSMTTIMEPPLRPS